MTAVPAAAPPGGGAAAGSDVTRKVWAGTTGIGAHVALVRCPWCQTPRTRRATYHRDPLVSPRPRSRRRGPTPTAAPARYIPPLHRRRRCAKALARGVRRLLGSWSARAPAAVPPPSRLRLRAAALGRGGPFRRLPPAAARALRAPSAPRRVRRRPRWPPLASDASPTPR